MGWRGGGDGDGTGAAAAAAGPGESEGEMNLWHWQSHSHRTGSGGRRSGDLIEDNDDTVRHLKHSTVGYSFFRPRFFPFFRPSPLLLPSNYGNTIRRLAAEQYARWLCLGLGHGAMSVQVSESGTRSVTNGTNSDGIASGSEQSPTERRNGSNFYRLRTHHEKVDNCVEADVEVDGGDSALDSDKKSPKCDSER